MSYKTRLVTLLSVLLLLGEWAGIVVLHNWGGDFIFGVGRIFLYSPKICPFKSSRSGPPEVGCSAPKATPTAFLAASGTNKYQTASVTCTVKKKALCWQQTLEHDV